jgi:hypothetical protein
MKSTRRTAIFVGVALSLMAAAVIAMPALASSSRHAFGALGSTNATSTSKAAWRFTQMGARSVTAEFRSPSVKCTSTTTGVLPGVAIGTGTPKNAEVNVSGVAYGCYKGKLGTAAYVEVDNTRMNVSKDVVPGDVMRATVTTSPKTTTATIADTTKGHTFTVTTSGTGGTSFAEDVWDDSLTSGTTQFPVADFGTISFSAAAVGGTPLGSVSPPGTAYNWVSSTKVVKVVTGPLTGATKNAFTTTWKHS